MTADRFEDAVLVRQVQSGQLHVFADLVRKYQDRIYNTCWRICGHPEDARDLTQEVFLKAFESMETFRGKSGFYTWIFRIAVNMAISQRRKSSRRRTVSADAGPDSQAAGLLRLVRDESSPDPAANCEDGETHEQVAAALSELDDDYRSVIVLRDVEGLDYQEIADVLELAVGTVKSRIHRGRLALRKLMNQRLDLESA